MSVLLADWFASGSVPKDPEQHRPRGADQPRACPSSSASSMTLLPEMPMSAPAQHPLALGEPWSLGSGVDVVVPIRCRWAQSKTTAARRHCLELI